MSPLLTSWPDAPGRRVAQSETLVFPLHERWNIETEQHAAAMGPFHWGGRILFQDLDIPAETTRLYCAALDSGRLDWMISNSGRGLWALSTVCCGVALFHGYDWSHPCYGYSIETGQCVWTAETVRPGLTHAATDGESRVFIDSGPGESQSLCALEAATGEVVWRRSYGGTFQVMATVAGAIALMAQNDQGSAVTLVVASEKSGEELWRLSPEAAAGQNVEEEMRGFVYVGAGDDCFFVRMVDGTVAAVNPDGSVRWRWHSDSRVGAMPVMLGEQVAFTDSGCFVRLDAQSGRELLRTGIPPSPWPGPSVGFIAGAHYIYAAGPQIVAIEWESGDVVWVKDAGSHCASPIVASDQLLVGTEGGHLRSFGSAPQ